MKNYKIKTLVSDNKKYKLETHMKGSGIVTLLS